MINYKIYRSKVKCTRKNIKIFNLHEREKQNQVEHSGNSKSFGHKIITNENDTNITRRK